MSIGGGINLGTATYRITGDASGATNAAAQANNALAQLQKVVATNWWGIQNLGLAFAALPAAVAAGAGAAINAAIEWEDAMFGVSRATGLFGEAVQGIEEDLLAVARTTPLATAELANLAAQGAALGVADENLARFAETMGILISATNLTTANVGDFARIINVMRIPQDEWEQYANTILEVGRNTAATESEILNLGRRLAPTASLVGATSAELLGLSAAILSLGPRAEAGATAVQKSLFDMTRAVSENTTELQTFADVAGVSAEEFARSFREEPVKAFATFLTGLARVQGGAETAIQILDSLGIKEARQAQALFALSEGTLQVGSEQSDLNAILAAATGWWTKSTALQDIAEEKAKTLSGQIQLLRNALFEMGAMIGEVMAGPVGFLIQRLLDFLAGIEALPTPIKLLGGALFFLVTGISAVLAALLLVGPRIIIAVDAFRRIQGAAFGVVPALANVQGQMYGTAAAATVMGAAVTRAAGQLNFAAINANLANFGTTAGAAASSSVALGAGATVAATGVSKLVTWGTRLAKIGGAAGIALTVLSLATTFLGNRSRETAEESEKLVEANEDLVSAIRQQGAIIGPASLDWLFATENYQKAKEAAIALGFSIDTLNRIITGQATPAEFDVFIQFLKEGEREAQAFGRQVLDLAEVFQVSARAANVTTFSLEDLNAVQEEAASQAQLTGEALEEEARRLEGIAQAFIDLGRAIISQREAQLALADAQEAYEEASRDAANPALAIRRAELEVAQARFDHAEAIANLAERERDLAQARQVGLERVVEAEADLLDAQDAYLDSLEKIEDLEQELAELRAGPSVDEIRDATNDLRNAELRLAAAHRTVADAEWFLQHLREEGASTRDIQDAEFALAEARQSVADAEDDLSDATQELNDLRDETTRQEEMADLERELARAQRDSAEALRNITEQTQALADARDRVARDLDYLEAQNDLVQAQLAVENANNRVQESERELEEARAGGRAQRELERAELDLQNAIIRVAEANVEVRKQQALANGETWDASDAAHALAQELEGLMGLAPTAATQQALRDYINLLKEAPTVPEIPDRPPIEFEPSDFGLPEISSIEDYKEDIEDVIGDIDLKKEGSDSGESWWDGFLKNFTGPIGIIASGAVAAAAIALGAGIGVAVVAAAAAAAGVALVVQFWPEISGFFSRLPGQIGGIISDAFGNPGNLFENAFAFGGNVVGAVGSGVSAGARGLSNVVGGAISGIFGSDNEEKAHTGGWNIGQNISRALGLGIWNNRGPIGTAIDDALGFLFGRTKSFLKIGSPSQVFVEFGQNIIQGLTNGIDSMQSALQNTMLKTLQKVVASFSGAGGALYSTGHQFMAGLFSGINDASHQVPHIAFKIRDSLVYYLNSSFGSLYNSGVYMMTGLFYGLEAYYEQVIKPWLKNLAKQIASIKGPKQYDLSILEPAGHWIMQGLMNGLQDEQSNLRKVLQETSGMIEEELAKDYVSSFLEALSGDPRLNFATSVAGMGVGTTTAPTSVVHQDNFNLQAITTADPAEVLNEYMWARRIRLRGAVK